MKRFLAGFVVAGTGLAGALAMSASMSAAAFGQDAEGDPVAGKRAFVQCGVCHSFDPSQRKPGPHLLGVVGRASGADENFNYSAALRDSEIVWDPQTLSDYLENPRAIVPGTTMVVRVPNEQRRLDIIAYLAEQDGESE